MPSTAKFRIQSPFPSSSFESFLFLFFVLIFNAIIINVLLQPSWTWIVFSFLFLSIYIIFLFWFGLVAKATDTHGIINDKNNGCRSFTLILFSLSLSISPLVSLRVLEISRNRFTDTHAFINNWNSKFSNQLIRQQNLSFARSEAKNQPNHFNHKKVVIA